MGSVVLAGATSGSTTITPTDAVTTTVTLPSTGGTLQTSGAGFTTNGVAYATSTSALATGSALQFDGSNLGLGVASPAWGSPFSGYAITLGAYGAIAQASTGSISVAENSYYNGTNWIYRNTGDNALRYVQGSGAHRWEYAASGTAGNTVTFTEAMRIDSSGNLGLGVTPSAFGSGIKAIQVGVTSSLANTAGGYTFLADNWYYNGGDKYITTGTSAIFAVNRALGGFYWYTAPSGTAGNAISFTQAMTLDNSGQLLVGLTSAYNTSCFQGYQTSAGNWVLAAKSTASAGNTYFITFVTSEGTQRGYIYYNGSSTVYSTSSDKRLKKNIVDAPSAVSDVLAIKIRSFDWKETDNHQKYGVVAQELQSIAPEAISTPPEKDGMLGVDYSKLVPMMIKSIQEQQTIIQSLTERITALEGK
jgi:hypothetical protein